MIILCREARGTNNNNPKFSKMCESTVDLDGICAILDKLTLDALLLIEEEVQLKLNLENAMIGGESHLAKSRYIMGVNNVSSLQLPTENSPEFSAAATVYANEDEKLYGEKSYELRLTQKTEDESVQDPLKWFGVLVPQNLNQAQKMYRLALQYAVQAVNTQTQLKETMNKICELKEVKNKFTAK